MPTVVPWQLRMFQKTLKKKQRLEALRRLLGRLPADGTCLLVTCGDNNGAINYYLRDLGGTWAWADLDPAGRDEMAALLGETVHPARPDALPFTDDAFDVVIAIDVHEHVAEPGAFTGEMQRVARPGGRVIVTVPGGDPHKLVNRLKRLVGMTTAAYGHVRDGYGPDELAALLQEARLRPVRTLTFSRFFTELIELAINVAYVKVLARRSATPVAAGTIAPQTEAQLASVKKTYRLYALVYPVVWLVSQLDRLLFFTEGYVVVAEGRNAA